MLDAHVLLLDLSRKGEGVLEPEGSEGSGGGAAHMIDLITAFGCGIFVGSFGTILILAALIK